MSIASRFSWPLFLLVLFAPAVTLAADEVSFAAGLRQRGLYRLAEVYCRRQIDTGNLTDRQQAELIIELARTHHQRGMELATAERAVAWNAAEQALDTYREASGTRNYILLIDLQESLLLLEQSELQRLEQLDRSAGTEVESIRIRLRAVIQQLRQVADQVEQRRRELAPGRATGDEAFSLAELDALDRHVNLSLAKALREQGLSYPPQSADRDDALLQAATSLRTLANDRIVDDITWQARVALLDTMADLRQTDEGLPVWHAWNGQSPPPTIGPRLLAVGARLLIAGGQQHEAAQRLQSSPWPPGTSAEVDFVRLELAVDQVERNAAGAEQLEPLLAVLREAHPPQWIRRGETLVGRTLAAQGDTASGLGLKHAAEHYFRAGRLDEAVATYDQLAEQARQQGNRDEVFAAERTAAAIVQSQHDYQQAADRFRGLALASRDKPESALAHREAILSLAAVARDVPPAERAKQLAEYVAACREHLQHWPEGPTSDEVRLWYGRLLVERHQWPVAIETLERVSSASPHSAPAMVLLAQAYRRQCETITDPSQLATAIRQATARLQPTIVAGGWPTAWTIEQRETAIELAQLQLLGGREGASYAERLLTAAMEGQPAPPAEWQSRAAPLMAMALVQGGKAREGLDWLRRATGDAQSLEALVQGLASSLRQLPPDDPQRPPLGQLLLAAIDSAGAAANQWTPPSDRYRAAGLAALGDHSQARTLYEELVARFPKDGDLAEEYATLLAASPAREDRESALVKWQLVEAGSQRGGERWRRARLNRIKLMQVLGQLAEARKLVQLTRLIDPDFGGGKLATEFETLSAELLPE